MPETSSHQKLMHLMSPTTKAVLALFTALRMALILDVLPPAVSTLINSRAVTSFILNPLHTVRHLREGNFLLDLSTSDAGGGGTLDYAYTGRAFHLPPLVLAVFRPFLSFSSLYVQNLLLGLFFLVVDLVVAVCIYDVARRTLLDVDGRSDRERSLESLMDEKIRPRRAWVFGLDFGARSLVQDEKENDKGDDSNGAGSEKPENAREQSSSKAKVPEAVVTIPDLPQLCCLIYYCNPISIIASCGTQLQSLQSLWYLLLLGALREVMVTPPESQGRARKTPTGRVPVAAFYLALAAYVEVYPVVYLVPITLLVSRATCGGNVRKTAIGCLGYFSLWFGLLQALSALLVGSDWSAVWTKTYGYVFNFTDLSPNLGLHWYFFVQMFDRFRLYFVVMTSGIPYLFVAPLTIRLYEYPIALVAAFFLLGSIFKPVPTLHDASIALSFLLMSPRTLARMGNASLVSLFAMVVPITLVVMFHWLWLETGSGNANYLFFQCLAYNTFIGVVTLDFVSATVKRDKALRLTEKNALSPEPSNSS